MMIMMIMITPGVTFFLFFLILSTPEVTLQYGLKNVTVRESARTVSSRRCVRKCCWVEFSFVRFFFCVVQCKI